MASVTAYGEEAGNAAAVNRHPTGLWFFFWGEFAERCSYYGMRAILFLYLAGDPTGVIKGGLNLGEDDASPIYFGFKMACYFLPLVGGFLADRFFGKYWTIVGFSVPYVLGHFVLGIESLPMVYLALALLAGGSGVIKPNISTLMGQTYDQQRPGNDSLRISAFLWFYFAINVGAVISTFALPWIRTNYGYSLAFQFPAWLMVASLLIFASGKRFYAVETRDTHRKTPEEKRQQWRTLWQLLGIFGLMVFWWVGYEHNDSLWVAFARDHMDLTVPGFGDRTLSPDQVQFLNPAFVLIFVPLFSWFFGKADPEVRIFTRTRKILAGFMISVVAIGLMAAAGYLAAATGEKVSVVWLALAYILLTAGEVLLYGTGLELAYSAAPKSMKSFVTACFLVTNALGNLINMRFSKCYGTSLDAVKNGANTLTPGPYFALTALIVLAAGIMFIFVGRRFDRDRAADAAAAA
ncbi:MAG TPA: MFS transporter [Gemmataceae bacterium]|nr:MFS transporter [Gemmataceae bacterium]